MKPEQITKNIIHRVTRAICSLEARIGECSGRLVELFAVFKFHDEMLHTRSYKGKENGCGLAIGGDVRGAKTFTVSSTGPFERCTEIRKRPTVKRKLPGTRVSSRVPRALPYPVFPQSALESVSRTVENARYAKLNHAARSYLALIASRVHVRDLFRMEK